ncbi:BamA/TamA family outer membrane protein [Flaviaesturariibacter terrae]
MLTGTSTYKYLSLLAALLLAAFTSSAQLERAAESLLFSTQEAVPHADTTGIYNVSDFEIEGNKHTRELIILRELPFQQGERYTLAELMARSRQARSRLLNTGLFLDVVVGVAKAEGEDAIILVSVKERWYFIPRPVLDVVGKSYQQWFQEGMPDGYLRYGVNIKHKNLTGLNDRLTVSLLNGYQKELGITYEGLPLDYRLRWTANFSFQMGQQRDIVYTTQNNKTLSLHGDNAFLYSYTRLQGSLGYRPAIKTRHSFGITWNDESFRDTVGKSNTSYFYNLARAQYAEVSYQMQYQDLDFVPYPTNGLEGELLLSKKGLDAGPINQWQLRARASWYAPITDKSFLNLRATGGIKLPFQQPYRLQGFAGGGDVFMQGYEPYTIDGVAGGFVKASIHRRILDRRFGVNIKRFPQLANVPVKIYAKAFGNSGYIYNENPGTNFLNNRLLYSAGVGLDLVLFYDFTFRIEWTVNGNAQNGLYLHDRNRW